MASSVWNRVRFVVGVSVAALGLGLVCFCAVVLAGGRANPPLAFFVIGGALVTGLGALTAAPRGWFAQ